MRSGWFVSYFALAQMGCTLQQGVIDPSSPQVPPRTDNKAFGNVQPHHVSGRQYHAALRSYGRHALFVCNASLPERDHVSALRSIVGPDPILLANDNSTFVPLWGEASDFWNAYRAVMDPATVGLPDSAWYWVDGNGERMRAPKPCAGGGWCGDYWPGWALKPDTSAYRAKADFLASRVGEFDGLWLDEWHEGFSAYQMEGLGLPLERRVGLSQRWIVCRRFYADLLRSFLGSSFLLVPNLQPERNTDYPSHEMVRFDGHTSEFSDDEDLARFRRYPSPYNVGWSATHDLVDVVRVGYGLPRNVDP